MVCIHTRFAVGLVAIMILFSGCRNIKSIERNPEAFENSELVEVILDVSKETSHRRAIAELEKRAAWKSLVKILPPHGGYCGNTMDGINAISKIGNIGAIPYLKEVRNTDEYVNGEFWGTLNLAIENLESIEQNKKKVQQEKGSRSQK